MPLVPPAADGESHRAGLFFISREAVSLRYKEHFAGTQEEHVMEIPVYETMQVRYDRTDSKEYLPQKEIGRYGKARTDGKGVLWGR